MLHIINKIASYFLFTKIHRPFEYNGWFETILYITFIEFLVLIPFVFYVALFVSLFVGWLIIPVSFFSSIVVLYVLNKKVYEKHNKGIVYELASEYDKSDLNKMRFIVVVTFLAALVFFICTLNWISGLLR
jgi:polyferredoxin